MTTSDQPQTHFSGLLTPCGTARFSGIEARIMLGGEQAAMTVMILTVTKGQGAPAHISLEEDKLFCVESGHLLFVIGTERILAQAGERVFVARGVTHGFSAVNTEAQMTLVSTPARHDRFFQAMSELPMPHAQADVQAVCKRFGQAIVGPIPTV
ncbi:cupin domain-containing protein [Sphingomonas sp. DT-51]|uniref:cupin domain-containing protein n=1 Tax=Sphingomonas sp. DT-51 TaxID=3396165 RepID=UPI003F1A107E